MFSAKNKEQEWNIVISDGNVTSIEFLDGCLALSPRTTYKRTPQLAEVQLTQAIKKAAFEFYAHNSQPVTFDSLIEMLNGEDLSVMEQVLKGLVEYYQKRLDGIEEAKQTER